MLQPTKEKTEHSPPAPVELLPRRSGTFIDLFAGCGGFSLGLMNAGWSGIFAVEKSPIAFETLKHNLITSQAPHTFEWPEWLPEEPFEIGVFLKQYRTQLKALHNEVDLIVGGPPCQGFSFAGRRQRDDERNQLFLRYIRMVTMIRPKYLLLENVAGIQVAHGKGNRALQPRRGRPPKPFSEKIRDALERIGYLVQSKVLRASDFGVPQHRPRFIVIGIRRDCITAIPEVDPFSLVKDVRVEFLRRKGLPLDRPVTAGEAISDLSVSRNGTRPSSDTKGFHEIAYQGPVTAFQHLLNGSVMPNSLRLANHRPSTIQRFNEILASCRKGVVLSVEDRERLGLKKHHTVVLNREEPSHTLTTLPDDLLHYAEPRILTVRESARLQSFPDWFEFRGKYTTGGLVRTKEVPRYTQVGNAVPPLLAECLGELLLQIDVQLEAARASALL